jgi:hypothetical protein
MRWYSLVPEDITEKENNCDAILRLDIPVVFKLNERMNENGALGKI